MTLIFPVKTSLIRVLLFDLGVEGLDDLGDLGGLGVEVVGDRLLKSISLIPGK